MIFVVIAEYSSRKGILKKEEGKKEIILQYILQEKEKY
jgi:hypothetical protein